GQYLRWDYRSGRRSGTRPFDKGAIHTFSSAIADKLDEIIRDASGHTPIQNELFETTRRTGHISLFDGSCLSVMPTLGTAQFDAIMTSPPYCNRYDYTRTY